MNGDESMKNMQENKFGILCTGSSGSLRNNCTGMVCPSARTAGVHIVSDIGISQGAARK